MNTTELQRYFPNQQIANLHRLLDVHSWEDFRREFLLGEGKASNTIATYQTAAKQFYDFTDGLHPMQAGTPEWIEQWYDSLLAGGVKLRHRVSQDSRTQVSVQAHRRTGAVL